MTRSSSREGSSNVVQLRFLSGKRAGQTHLVTQLPSSVGKSPGSDLVLDDPGVWDQHLEFTLDPSLAFNLRVREPALAYLNDRQISEASLRNGDVIRLGALKLQFFLSDARPRSLRARELATWAGVGLVSALQLVLIYAVLL